MEKNELRSIIESLLFMSTEPMTVSEIKKIIDGVKKSSSDPMSAEAPVEAEVNPMVQLEEMQNRLEGEVSKGEIKDCLLEMIQEGQNAPGRGFELVEVAKGFQYRTRLEVTPFVKALTKISPNRLSAPGLETLAIVAYQQPVTRARVEEIRGVESGGVLKTLMERNLVRVVGRSEEPGRPILYGTTSAFLEVFGLNALSDLPTLKDLDLIEEAPPVSSGGAGMADEITESFSDEAQASNVGDEDEGSHELIEDLENSIRSLRDLEKKIFNTEEEENSKSEALNPKQDQND